jgi:hypothetical protein
MKTYELDAIEFAKIEYLLNRMVNFHRQDRNESETIDFSNEIYALLHEVTYNIFGPKINDRQHNALSDVEIWPPTKLSQQEAIQALTAIFSK